MLGGWDHAARLLPHQRKGQRMTDQSVHPDAGRWDGWHWREPHRGEHFRRCSFCGSINPEDLAAEPEWANLSWADWKYGWPHKFYVGIPNRTPGRQYVLSASTSLPSSQPERYVAWNKLTGEQRDVVRRDGWDDEGRRSSYFEFGTHSTHFGKFYSIHLSDSELGTEVKRLIEHRSGLTFEFTEGRVRWRPARPLSP
jgi:hypothetical protein